MSVLRVRPVVGALLAVVLTGCDGPPPAQQREMAVSQTRPTDEIRPLGPGAAEPSTRPGRDRAAAPASQHAGVGDPADQDTAGGAGASGEGETSRDPPIEAPDYVTVLERVNPREPATAAGRAETPDRLWIDTQNVRRLRIARERLPLSRTQSTALVIDGQVIEWTARSEVVEFERTPLGEWLPVKPQARTP